MEQGVGSSRCGGCLKARQDPAEKYVCPKVRKHGKDGEQQEQF